MKKLLVTSIAALFLATGMVTSALADERCDTLHTSDARVKNGNPATHPLTGKELRALRKLQREAPTSAFVFVSMRGTPFTVSGFRRMLERAAAEAGMEALKIHPHMLRHAAGYQLANQGTDTRTIQAYLGHRNISNTVRYTELSARRFKGLFRD